MKRKCMTSVLIISIVLAVGLIGTARVPMPSTVDNNDECSPRDLVKRGLKIAPVPLDLAGKDRDLVGLGSYLVNAVAGCNDCHTCPSYAPGHSPYQGGDGQINATNYLAGGVAFGPFVSRNITPDASDRPAGLKYEEFLHVIRTGEDPDEPGQVLQVMPWPIYRNMAEQNIRAIYEYLRAIPHAEPGSCGGPGQ